MPLPSVTSGLQWWFDARDIVGHVDGDVITVWPDSTGNGHDATASTGTATYHTNQFNGGAALTLASCSMLMAGSVGTTGIYTIFAIFRNASLGGGFLYGCNSGVGICCITCQTSGGIQRQQEAFSATGTGNEGYGTATADTAWHKTVLAQNQSSSLAFRIDGANDPVTGLGGWASANPAPTLIGASSIGQYFDGQIQALGYFNRLLSGPEILAVEASLVIPKLITVVSFVGAVGVREVQAAQGTTGTTNTLTTSAAVTNKDLALYFETELDSAAPTLSVNRGTNLQAIAFANAASLVKTEVPPGGAVSAAFTRTNSTNAGWGESIVIVTAGSLVVFSPPGGTIFPDTLQTVSLSAPVGDSIFYTTDGSTPTISSARYTSPLPIAFAQTIKAIAVAPDGTVSAVATASYTIGIPPPPVSSGTGKLFWLTDNSSNPYTDSPSPTDINFIANHIHRIAFYPPYGDTRNSWVPSYFYRDSSALYTGQFTPASQPTWVYKDAASHLCFINFGTRNPDGTYAQYLAFPCDAGFSSSWIALATSSLAAGYSGIFIDDVGMDINAVIAGGTAVIPIDPGTGLAITAAAYQTYLVVFLEAIKTAFPSTEIVHSGVWHSAGGDPSLNTLLTRQIQACSFYYIGQGFDDPTLDGTSGPLGILTLFGFIDQVHGLSRHFIAGQYNVSITDYFALACFLLVSDGTDMFEPSVGMIPTAWPAIDYVVLGAPSGARFFDSGLNLYRRNYANGIVLMSLPGASGGGALGGTYIDPTGNAITTIALGSRTGTVLLPAVPGYYVSPSGNDSWSGLSPSPNTGGTDGPFLTLGHAQTAMQGGSLKTTSIRAGTYSLPGGLAFSSSDNGESWLAYASEAPVIDGGGTGTFGMTAANNVTFKHLTFQNMGSNSININFGDSLTFARCTFLASVTAGISGNFVTNSLVDSNTFIGQSPGNSGGPGSANATVNFFGTSSTNTVTHNLFQNTEGGCVAFSNGPTQSGCSSNLIDRNECVNVCTNVIDFGPLYIYGPDHGGTGNQITNNVINGFGGPSGIANAVKGLYLDDETSNVLVSGNVVRGTGAWACMVHGGDHNTFQNNILDLSNGTKFSFYQASPIHDYGMGSNVYTKNLVYSSGGFPSTLHDVNVLGGDALPADSDNLYYSATAAFIPNTDIVDSSRVLANPLFNSPSTGDYSMPSTSPAFITVRFVALPTDQGPQ